MKIKLEGIDDAIKDLEKIAEGVSKTANDIRRDFSIEEILNEAFMQVHTEFPNLKEFFDSSGIDNVEDKLDSPEFTQFVKDNTPFKDFDDMWETAAYERTAGTLDKNVDW